MQGQTSLNVVRILLGIAEAGFFPGIIFFLTLWFPSAYRARIVGLFMFAIPISTVIGAPISGALLNLDGAMGLHGWQWMFIVEAVPALVMSAAVFFYLTDRPLDAHWLDRRGKLRLAAEARLNAERGDSANASAPMSWYRARCSIPAVIALGFVYMGCNIPQYGLSFFLPQIVKAFGIDQRAGRIRHGPALCGRRRQR